VAGEQDVGMHSLTNEIDRAFQPTTTVCHISKFSMSLSVCINPHSDIVQTLYVTSFPESGLMYSACISYGI
jgi:hypothetical protein